MDAEYAHSLLTTDTEYLEPTQSRRQEIDYVRFTKTGEVNHKKLVLDPDRERQLSEMSTAANSSSIFIIYQRRVYHGESARSKVTLSRGTWLDILDQLMIPSTAVEVLHDNNGGCGSHVSYCSANGPHPCQPTSEGRCACHIWVKLNCGVFEHFAYARHDFHTGRNVVLVLGTNGKQYARRLTSQFRGQSQLCLFHILLALTSSWSRQIEEYRWRLDSATRDIESRTGHSSFRFRDVVPLALEQLSLTKDITMTSDGIQNKIAGASNMTNIFSFLLTQFKRYAELSSGLWKPEAPTQLETHLCDALSQCLSQANAQLIQMRDLKGRVDAQWGVVNALIAQRDSKVNIDIAAAAQADSEIMRGIAFVTMIFLPATFMATFFSMVFFHLGSEDRAHLAVSKWIWLYPVCTIPLTVVLASYYDRNSWLKTRFQGCRKFKNLPKQGKDNHQN